jgi:hypothetical protein
MIQQHNLDSKFPLSIKESNEFVRIRLIIADRTKIDLMKRQSYLETVFSCQGIITEYRLSPKADLYTSSIV